MSLQRTPPKPSNTVSLANSPTVVYGSDSQLYMSPGQSDRITRRTKRKISIGKASEQDSTDDHSMKGLFDSFVQQQDTKFKQILDSVATIREQNNDILKSMEFLSAKYEEVLEKVTHLEQKNKSYESKIEFLDNRIEQLERSSRASSIELKNIPKQATEKKSDLYTIVRRVAEVIEQPLSDSEIHDIYRLKSSEESNSHIIVNFKNTSLKDGFLSKCRIYNKSHTGNKLNTSHLQLTSPKRPIYVDESLTSLGRRLAFLARQFIKDNHYHSTWTAYGKVFVKKSQESPIHRIDNEKDLQKLLLI